MNNPIAQVQDYMTQKVHTIRPEAPVMDAAKIMLEHKISGLPVVDQGGILRGVITEMDLLVLMSEPDSDSKYVYDYMTKDVSTFHPAESVVEATSFFLDSRLRRVPVVNDAGKLLGVIARRDIIKAIAQKKNDLQ